MTASKIVAAAASGVDTGDPVDITDVFSIDLYDGNQTSRQIETGLAIGNSFTGGSGSFHPKQADAYNTTQNDSTRVEVATSSNFDFGTGDFTIEAFIFLDKQKNFNNIYDQRSSSQDATTNSPIIYIDSNNYIIYYVNGTKATSSAISLGVWYHVAVTRASGSTKLFLDGTQQGSTFSDSLTYVQPASNFSFGGSLEQGTYNFSGHISNLRVVKGTAVYTSNFTKPTSELTAISGTSLLTCQGSTPFVDNSGNSVSLTQNNDPQESAFGPFTGSEAGDGGMVWIKSRSSSDGHFLFDTERGVTKRLRTHNNNGETTDTSSLTSFNGSGFSIGNSSSMNGNGVNICAWSFKKAARFFDVVKWDGNSTAGRTISHNLGSVPGFIMIKRTSATEDWTCYHRKMHASEPEDYFVNFNGASASSDNATAFNDTAPTSTVFTVGASNRVNASGDSYVAYLFAHNNNDGRFGPDKDQDIIKCGGYNGTGSAGNFINVGFEPGFLMIKKINASQNAFFYMHDSARMMSSVSSDERILYGGATAAEFGGDELKLNPNGFTLTQPDNGWNGSGDEYIYIAIRKGQLTPPTKASDVFDILNYSGNGSTRIFNIGITPDMATSFSMTVNGDSRMLTHRQMLTRTVNTSDDGPKSGAAFNGIRMQLDYTKQIEVPSFRVTNNENYLTHMWREAVGYFDTVYYESSSGAKAINHNLGVVPEMMWVKNMDSSENWAVYHKGLNGGTDPEDYYVLLNSSNQQANSADWWNDTAPTATQFTVGTQGQVNEQASTKAYLAFLFASVDGVSKVGSYTGNGDYSTGQTIDCGFSNGARFVITKDASASEAWNSFTSDTGIVAGTDKNMQWNNSSINITSTDYIDPNSSGFQAVSDHTNTNGRTYIFYAIAA